MPTLLKSEANYAKPSLQLKTSGGGSASIRSGDFLFFGDSPETVLTSHLADSGKYLHWANVTGNGQVYTWHSNQTGSTINSCLLFYNGNSFPVTVSSTNYGTTKLSGVQSDSAAWASYMKGGSTASVNVAAKGYQKMFLQSVPNNYVFGILARLKVTNSNTGALATVGLYDLAYRTNDSGATSFAPYVAPHLRGSGNGYYTTVSLNPMSPPANKSGGIAYTLAASFDSLNGQDCAYITGASGSPSGKLEGCYGQQLIVTLPIKNTTDKARKFRIFVGTQATGKYSTLYPFVSIGGNSVAPGTTIAPGLFRDVIETDLIGVGATLNTSFTTAVPAVSSTPYIIGAYAI